MKNLNNTFAAVVMMFVIAFGTTFANAGIIIAKSEAREPTCSTNKGVFDKIGRILLEGIIIAKTGIIIAKEGIIIARDQPCTSTTTKEGIIIA
ncbi:MAG: hypothetical protein DMF62_15755 [Acidobacteria bacterium]|nr:MAG: hypothetical protein DMF62_15755 [Acidobacteriota bacterium]